MKKTLLSLAILAASGAFAQTTVTFDDLTLDTNSYWSGSDGSGSFVANGITFPNEYDMQWSYWSGGFIYSNSTDITTAGYTNDFSAYTGIGADGSANYGVNYGGNLDFVTPRVLSSIDITNTTYAALSMLNGDSFGKQFGSPNNAAGNPDGTNGEDFFRLLITGYDVNNDSIGTVTFYLADYRFADSTQDYILDTWETVDLSSLGEVRYLDFELESSDTNALGILTPGYFALDNLIYDDVAGVEENPALAFTLYPNPANGQFTVKGTAGTITVRQANGTTIHTAITNGFSTIDCASWAAGAYLVEVTNENGVSRNTFMKN
ncbi:MAG: hypothetical protein A3D31_04395 [Candidatus Fluviicola riflensis]|nr:MAG: hypothetical protein CHH17_10630 [Candidatus Fluviicola riflensis]OGS79216.1 MAG: hypothetical protein A3D31_04395 [Candidatus Fluviicola riflensis]OGS86648.1 MAG: hypothetical protein A2724_03855 [Fluviicola sp. RIFCSPHIGHO2_01_FULL_43_53]OGS88878.1 MAG: hypothetical protein A3E30_00805 [Fluviicola sp. RIFCSPHIGHO2_12_FULL_43_24]